MLSSLPLMFNTKSYRYNSLMYAGSTLWNPMAVDVKMSPTLNGFFLIETHDMFQCNVYKMQ